MTGTFERLGVSRDGGRLGHGTGLREETHVSLDTELLVRHLPDLPQLATPPRDGVGWLSGAAPSDPGAPRPFLPCDWSELSSSMGEIKGTPDSKTSYEKGMRNISLTITLYVWRVEMVLFWIDWVKNRFSGQSAGSVSRTRDS